jgi:phosphoglycolate phosphatase-like HAD superfamily hydrolase
METMTLIICDEELELTAQEVQEQLDSLFKEIERLKKESKEKDERGDMWWNSYQDEQKRNARIRKAIEAAKTVLEMC